MKYGVIVSARMGSKRLPGKALLPLGNVPVVVFLLRRLKPSLEASSIIFATTNLPEDDVLADIVNNENIPVFRGENEDVSKRLIDAGIFYDIDNIIRVTGDCPFVDYVSLDYCIKKCKEWGMFDLATTKNNFPVGIDYEIFNLMTLKKLHDNGQLGTDDKEHVTKYLYDHKNMYNIKSIFPKTEWISKNKRHLTLDTKEDYTYIKSIIDSLNIGELSIENILGSML